MAKKSSVTKDWLNYYNRALTEGAYLSPHKAEKKTTLFDVKDLYSINSSLPEELERFITESLTSKDKVNKFVLLPLKYTAPNRNEYYPFAIPFVAEKSKDGDISICPPEQGSFPVISRDFLSPSDENLPSIAELDNLWEASTDMREKEYDEWKDYMKDVFDLFKKVTNTEFGKDIGYGFSWDTLGVGKGDVFTIFHLQKLYKKITSDSNYLGYYDKLFAKPEQDNDIVGENNLHASTCHFGHMDNKFSLSRTQREAIHSWILNDTLHNKEGHMRVMAVNGPPGTGKTTFLSGLIASHIVHSVLLKKYPRFILTSFTNKAVTNILDSFSRCAKDIRLIETEQDIGLSIYFPRADAEEKDKYPYLILQRGKFTGSILKIEEQFGADEEVDKYIAKVEKDLGINLSRYRGREKKLDHISSHIYSQLDSEYRIISKLGYERQIQSYDTEHRFNAYRWAIRWLECEWIKRRPKNTEIPTKELMEWRMLLTPCVVGTVYKLPQWFEDKADNHSKSTYWFENADYLIIDEAGQGCPEVAVPLFGLAKNAIVVGDTEQLQPIWSISPEWDESIKNGIFPDEQSDIAMLSSSGSIMSVAQKVCPVKHPDPNIRTRGAILLNHRRCYKEIIELCNALCYSHQGYTLETNTSPIESSFYKLFIEDGTVKDPLFPIGLIEVNGQCTKDHNTRSNKNTEEIDAIVEWVEKNWMSLVEAYAKKEDLEVATDKRTLIKDVLAVLTPYRGQERQIKSALKSKGLFLDKFPIVIGTVHKLQGAEKPVVLFSTVLDGSKNSRPEFIDKHMLNVAVSRAKKSFIVFSNPALYNIVEEGTPLDIMKKYIDNWTEKHPVRDPIILPPEIADEGKKIVSENEKLKKEKYDLDEKNQEFLDKINDLEVEMHSLKKTVDSLEKENKQLKESIKNKSEEIKDLQGEVSGLRAQKNYAERRCEELNQKISNLNGENESLNRRSMFLHSRLDEIQSSPKKALVTLFKAIIKMK